MGGKTIFDYTLYPQPPQQYPPIPPANPNPAHNPTGPAMAAKLLPVPNMQPTLPKQPPHPVLLQHPAIDSRFTIFLIINKQRFQT